MTTDISQNLPGVLAWASATDRPDLLAAPTVAALADLDIAAYVAPIDAELADTEAFCRAYQVPEDTSANCVIVQGKRAGEEHTAAVLVRASDRADVNRTVRKHLGVRKASFAPREFAVGTTGMEYGGITPVGLPAGWPLLVDDAVGALEWAVVGSGIRGSKLAVRGSDLDRLPGAEFLALAIPPEG